jgi:hypothetical protein
VVVVGTVGDAVPVEILAAAEVEVVPILGVPGEPTPVADGYVEPLVGERARSQLQRLLDGTYTGLDLVLLSREQDAGLRLFHTLREIRRIEPSREVPPSYLFDLQHTGTAAAAAWNRARISDLCALFEVEDGDLARGIRACNAERLDSAPPQKGRRRVYVTGSAYADTALPRAIHEAGGTVVAGPPVPADEELEPREALARRYEHPLLAGARGSSVERHADTALPRAAAQADIVVGFYLEGDDGLRWELPELRSVLDEAGLPLVVVDRQPYDLQAVSLDV